MPTFYTARASSVVARARRIAGATTATMTLLAPYIPVTGLYRCQTAGMVGTGSTAALTNTISWTDPDVGAVTSSPPYSGSRVPGVRRVDPELMSVQGGTTVTITVSSNTTDTVYWSGMVERLPEA